MSDFGRRGRSYREALRARAFSFRHAFAGVQFMLGEPNFRIHLIVAGCVLVAAAVLHVTPAEWLALILVSLAVLLMEMLNTVIEAMVDIVTPEYHPLAKVAKDVAAGAVVIAAFGAVVVGVYVFVPHLAHLVRHR